MERKKLLVPSLDECLKASGGTTALVTESNAYRKIPELLTKEYGSWRLFIIADENTMLAAGNVLLDLLAVEGIEIAGKHIFPGEPRLHGEYRHIETLAEEMAAARDSGGTFVPVAIGAGTINDLVKRAAGELELPYLCVPTAASVDGFTSYGSAILKDGLKQTLSCDAPRCVVADTGVMAKAPSWLSSSGFADLAGKIIGGADWLIADAAAPFGAKGADRIEPTAWAMVQHGLYDYLDRSVTAADGDEDALKALFEALSMTGFSMQYARDSRPVSGSEHLYAHVWEMDDLCVDGNPVTHGHKVGIGSLASAAFLEVLFADPKGPPPRPASWRRPTLDERVAEIKAAFAHNTAGLETVVNTGIDKFPDEKTAAAANDGFRDTWKDIREKVLEQTLPYAQFNEMLRKARCPVMPAQVNLTRTEVITCARRAQMIRKRYNELDLAWDLGCFETVLARMEASDKYFR